MVNTFNFNFLSKIKLVKQNQISLYFFIVFALFSCEKDNNNKPASLTKCNLTEVKFYDLEDGSLQETYRMIYDANGLVSKIYPGPIFQPSDSIIFLYNLDGKIEYVLNSLNSFNSLDTVEQYFYNNQGLLKEVQKISNTTVFVIEQLEYQNSILSQYKFIDVFNNESEKYSINIENGNIIDYVMIERNDTTVSSQQKRLEFEYSNAKNPYRDFPIIEFNLFNYFNRNVYDKVVSIDNNIELQVNRFQHDLNIHGYPIETRFSEGNNLPFSLGIRNSFNCNN